MMIAGMDGLVLHSRHHYAVSLKAFKYTFLSSTNSVMMFVGFTVLLRGFFQSPYVSLRHLFASQVFMSQPASRE